MIRQTRQRAAILKALELAQRPLSPLELHAKARAFLPSLGLRTVYRQIKDLTLEGSLVGVDYPGQPVSYELNVGRHQAHFICRTCRKLFSLDAEVPDIPPPVLPPLFVCEGQETVFYGTCADCGSATSDAGAPSLARASGI